MVTKPGLRKFALTAHVTSSVGWFGAVAAFLAVALAALLDSDDQKARAASTTMKLIGWFVIVPFRAASLVSGVVQSFVTSWGLFRHYWVIAKLLIAVGASGLLLLHMQVVNSIALAASNGSATAGHMQGPKMQIVADEGAGLVVLLLAIGCRFTNPQAERTKRRPDGCVSPLRSSRF